MLERQHPMTSLIHHQNSRILPSYSETCDRPSVSPPPFALSALALRLLKFHFFFALLHSYGQLSWTSRAIAISRWWTTASTLSHSRSDTMNMTADCQFCLDACRSSRSKFGTGTSRAHPPYWPQLTYIKDGIQLKEENYRNPMFWAHVKIYVFWYRIIHMIIFILNFIFAFSLDIEEEAKGVVAHVPLDSLMRWAIVDVSYAAPQAHEIANVSLHREYSTCIIFIFS
jgi:hypothetical protein